MSRSNLVKRRATRVLMALAGSAALASVGTSAVASSYTIAANGVAVRVTTTAPDEVATATFPGTAGQKVSLQVRDVTFGTSTCCGATVTIKRPDGTNLVSRSVGTRGTFIDATALPVSGTYRIVVDPAGTVTGGATLRLYDVTSDVAGAISPGGAAITASNTVPGQNVRLRFTATAGARIAVKLGPAAFVHKVSIVRTNGTAVGAATSIGPSGGFVEPVTLPADGVYDVKLDPNADAVGAMTATAYVVPPDVTGSVSIGGAPVTVTTTVPGQNARIGFTGTAGTRVSARLAPMQCCTAKVSILNSAGTALATPRRIGGNGGATDPVSLPADGAYTVLVDAEAAGAGSITVTLTAATPDLRVDTAPDGIARTFTTAPGQNARLQFAGTVGQRIAAVFEAACCAAVASLLRPDGTVVGATASITTSGGFLDTRTLDVTGTYTLVVDPQFDAAGSFTAAIHTVPADSVTEGAIGGGPATISTTVPGENAKMLFAGTAGQRVDLLVSHVTYGTSNCCGVHVTVKRPNGVTQATKGNIGTTGAAIDLGQLGATGTYTVLVDPIGPLTGSLRLTPQLKSDDLTGTIVPDGSAVTLTTATAGQNVRLAFSGAAGDGLAIRLSAMCCSTTVAVLRPDGSQLSSTSVPLSGGTAYTRLDATGVHTLLIDPVTASSGSMTVQLLTDRAAPSTPVLTVTERAVDSHAVGSAFFYRPAGAGGTFTVTAATTDTGLGMWDVSFPGLSDGMTPTTGYGDATAPFSRTYTWATGATRSGDVTVTARDLVGHTASAAFSITPDADAPVTGDNAAALGTGWHASPRTVSLSPADGGSGAAATYWTSNGTTPTTTSAKGTSVLLATDGTYTLRYFSVDNVGNAEAVRVAANPVRIDVTAPTVTLGALPATIRAGQVLTATAADATSGMASVTYRYCAGATCTPTTAIATSTAAPGYAVTWSSQPPDGTYQVVARATDVAGNVRDSLPRTVTIDNTPPVTTIVTNPADPSNDASPTFAFASEPGSTFQCRVDAAAFAACTSPKTFLGLAEGLHTFDVRAVDAAGNAETGAVRYSWRIDRTPPETEILTAPPARTGASTGAVSFTSADGGARFECRVDAAAWAACSSPATVGPLADGLHSFEVRAIDLAGNPDATPARATWTVDTTAPETTVTSGPSGAVASTSATFGFTASETGSTFECRLDGGAWTACTSPRAHTSLAEGAHTFEVRATDVVGNLDATPASRSWTVDVTAPDTVLDAAPAALVVTTDARFEFSSPDAGVTFECRLDAGVWSACASPHAASGLADGAHVFEVRAVDAAGNRDATAARASWTVDTSAPDTTIESGPSGAAAATSAEFAVASGEPGASFECRLDAAAWEACGSEPSYAGLAEGSHTFEVRALDAAGNADPTPATRSWTVDVTPPGTAIDASPPAVADTGDATFAFSSTDPDATFECRLDGAAWTACVSPHAYSGLAGGQHRFEVRARDAAGNADPAPPAWEWTVTTPVP